MSVLETFLTLLSHALMSVWRFAGTTIILFVISKLLWRWYILKKAEDRSSPLTKKLPLPPGDFGLPFIGETISWALQGSKFNSSRRIKYGKLFSTHFLGNAMVKVTGAQNVQQILQGEHEKVTTIWPITIRRILGEHTIGNSVGDDHKYKRRLASKGFSHSALNSYIPDMRSIISKKVRSWAEGNGTKKIYPDILQTTFKVASKAMVGLTYNTTEEMNKMFQTFDKMNRNLLSLPYDVPFSGFRKGLQAKETFHNFMDEHLKKKIKRLNCNANDGNDDIEQQNDVMQYWLEGELLERRKRRSNDPDSDSDMSQCDSIVEEEDFGIPLEELKQYALELMFAGYLTNGSSISSLIIQLAKHPEVRKKIEKELEEHGIINHTHPEDEIDVDLEKLQKLRYVEQVFKETMRVMPPILGGYRRALKTFQIGEYRIPKDWTIIYNIRDTHDYEFKDDTEFDPDRFSRERWSEDKENRHRWIPFGGGPRMCVGKEFGRLQFKLVIIELVRAFSNWEFQDGKAPPMFAVPALHPTNGLPIKFTPRIK